MNASIPERASVAASEPWIGMRHPTEDRDRLPDEHAYPPRPCVIADLAEVRPDTPAEFSEDLNAYLAAFAAPTKKDETNLCFHCGEAFNGGLAQQLFGNGGFEWGLTHGDGYCKCCGWPARLYHFIRDRHGDDLITMRHIVLPYLPADVGSTSDTGRQLREDQ